MANFIKNLFSRPKDSDRLPTDTSPGGAFSGLRQQALALDSETLDLPEGTVHPFVWGSLVETDYTGVTATLFTLADGTTSLYLSSGGGMIGGHAHEAVCQASAAYLDLANRYSNHLSVCDSYPVPQDEGTVFYFLTDLGVMRLDPGTFTSESDRDIPLELFSAGQDILTEFRLISESSEPPPAE